jgi:signal transduction histidine kinase
MSDSLMSIVYLFYGLAFFSMGLVVMLEGGRSSDERLRHALRPLAAFGLIHGLNEWVDLFHRADLLPAQAIAEPLWIAFHLAILAFSFLSLAAFGASLLSPTPEIRRISLLLPLALVTVWSVGLLSWRGEYTTVPELWTVADVWTRYTLAIPAALLACAGLLAQQRAFRRAGMAEFGRDTLWAAAAFAWYGLIGQLFTRPSPIFPSTIINYDLFLAIFGFPVQILRAVAAAAAAIFIIRSLRASEVETQRQISRLQAERLEEAERREALRGRLLGQIVAAQEAERQRVARELHDETGQALTAIGMGLRGVATTLRQDVDLAGQNLRQLESLVDNALDELQRLIADLRPSHLDDLGLAAALRWWTGAVQERTGLRIKVETIGSERPLPAHARTALFRVAQEALTNVVKHSQATSVRVELCFDDTAVMVLVEDDGCGFNVPARLANGERRSWGLIGMRERAFLLGGDFELYSCPGEGTRVRVSVPYEVSYDHSSPVS